MKRHFYLLALAAITTIRLGAQTSPQYTASEILQGIKKLNVTGAVLYIAAHPDDENTRLLSYLNSERHLRTGYLSLTRGDGGQNLVGKEQGEPLGLIRTQELLAARRIDGAEQFFTRANDFGFSKNPEETFTIWNRDSVLADMVWVIRNFKPDVLICRFPTTGEGGHGHHTASAILALEAFDAAGDPKKFPGQLKYVSVWKPQRIFWNTFNFGGNNTTANDQLKIDVGVFNPLLGKGYGEIAAESRSMHKSQGFGAAKRRGEDIEYFKLLKGSEVKTDLFEGIETGWATFREGNKMTAMVEECIRRYDVTHPEKSVPALVQMYQYLNTSMKSDPTYVYWRKQKLSELEKLILNCAGLWAEAFVPSPFMVPGETVTIQPQIVVRNQVPVTLKKIMYLKQVDSLHNQILQHNVLYSFKHKDKLGENLPYSSPYWLNEKHEPGMYVVKKQQSIGLPENGPLPGVMFEVEIAGQPFYLERELLYRYTDPIKGDILRKLEMVPALTVNVSDQVLVFTSNEPKPISFTVKANQAVQGYLEAQLPQGWKISFEKNEFNLSKPNEEVEIKAWVSPGDEKQNGTLNVRAYHDVKTPLYTKSIQRIEYDHIPYQFILSEPEAKLIHLDLRKKGTQIGYIPGAGDAIPDCLKQIGYTVTQLTDAQLSGGDLSVYDAIVTGVRAYNTNERMPTYHQRLMEYVSKGGNLLVQYNTNNRVGPLSSSIGPYPFTISRDRVTDEKAEVTFIKKEDPILHYPNAIGTNDFKGWIQERGIYFATERDSAYETVLNMHDPGENDLDGSIISINYGKGRFIYTGLSFFRQLPAGVPGAYRLFVNLLSLPPRNQ